MLVEHYRSIVQIGNLGGSGGLRHHRFHSSYPSTVTPISAQPLPHLPLSGTVYGGEYVYVTLCPQLTIVTPWWSSPLSGITTTGVVRMVGGAGLIVAVETEEGVTVLGYYADENVRTLQTFRGRLFSLVGDGTYWSLTVEYEEQYLLYHSRYDTAFTSTVYRLSHTPLFSVYSGGELYSTDGEEIYLGRELWKRVPGEYLLEGEGEPLVYRSGSVYTVEGVPLFTPPTNALYSASARVYYTRDTVYTLDGREFSVRGGEISQIYVGDRFQMVVLPTPGGTLQLTGDDGVTYCTLHRPSGVPVLVQYYPVSCRVYLSLPVTDGALYLQTLVGQTLIVGKMEREVCEEVTAVYLPYPRDGLTLIPSPQRNGWRGDIVYVSTVNNIS